MSFAFVPTCQRPAGQGTQGCVNQDASQGDEGQGCEQTWNVELVTRLQDLIGQPRLRATGTRYKLGHDGADQGQTAGDAPAGQHIGQGAGQPQAPECLQAAGPLQAEVVAQARRHATKAHRGVGDDGKQGDDRGADHQGRLRFFDPNDDQGGNGHDGGDLQQDGVRQQGGFQPKALNHQKGQQRPQNNRTDKGPKGDRQGGQ